MVQPFVTGGNKHDHSGGDGAQIDHGSLGGLSDNDHTQYISHALATALSDFLVASGSGAFVKKTLAETKTILGIGASSSAIYKNIMDYGGVGDGTADESGALGSAMAALGSGGVIFFPAGTYLFGTAVNVNGKYTFLGEGFSENPASYDAPTVIQKAATLGTALFGGTGNAVQFANMMIEGLGTNAGDGIHVLGNRWVFENVTVTGMGGNGIRIGADGTGYNCNLWRMYNVHAMVNGSNGVYISDKAHPTSPDANAGVAIGLNCQNNTADGLRLGNCHYCSFVMLHVAGNTGYGMHAGSGAYWHQFFGGDWDEGNHGGTSEAIFGTASSQNVLYGVKVPIGEVEDYGTSNHLNVIDPTYGYMPFGVIHGWQNISYNATYFGADGTASFDVASGDVQIFRYKFLDEQTMLMEFTLATVGVSSGPTNFVTIGLPTGYVVSGNQAGLYSVYINSGTAPIGYSFAVDAADHVRLYYDNTQTAWVNATNTLYLRGSLSLKVAKA